MFCGTYLESVKRLQVKKCCLLAFRRVLKTVQIFCSDIFYDWSYEIFDRIFVTKRPV